MKAAITLLAGGVMFTVVFIGGLIGGALGTYALFFADIERGKAYPASYRIKYGVEHGGNDDDR